MLLQLCAGFACGVVATLALVDCDLRCRSEVRQCMRQLEAMESYFVGRCTAELRVHCRNGFLTFCGGQYAGYKAYENI